ISAPRKSQRAPSRTISGAVVRKRQDGTQRWSDRLRVALNGRQECLPYNSRGRQREKIPHIFGTPSAIRISTLLPPF
ncbi:MAG: hypothetical protein ABJB97_08795, partial [Acidobacteriota bacterium]